MDPQGETKTTQGSPDPYSYLVVQKGDTRPTSLRQPTGRRSFRQDPSRGWLLGAPVPSDGLVQEPLVLQ